MPDRSPPKPTTNLGKPLSNSAVRGLMRAMMSVKAPSGRAARFDAAANRGPVRFFTSEQMLQLAARMEKLSAAGKVAKLKSKTANLCARALRAYAARPDYEELVRAICGSKSCAVHKTCFGCRSKANLICRFSRGKRRSTRRASEVLGVERMVQIAMRGVGGSSEKQPPGSPSRRYGVIHRFASATARPKVASVA
jgi:hypothetical protein